VHSSTELEFIQDICRIIVEQGEYQLAWVGFPIDNDEKKIHPIAYWGDKTWYQAYISKNLTWGGEESSLGPVGNAIIKGRPQVVHSISQDNYFNMFRPDMTNLGGKSVISLPLMNGDTNVGVLTIVAGESNVFVDTEFDLLMELADDLAYGISMFRVQVEREAVQAALKNSEEQYRSLFTGVPIGIYRASVDGKIIDANPALLKILGVNDMDDLMSLNFIKTYLSEDEAQRLYSDVAKKGSVDNFETKITNYLGQEIWVSLKLQAVYGNQKNRILYVEGAVEDITHRKRADEHIHSLTQELIKAQESERQRIARDLHDHVAQNLGALKISCETMFMSQLENPEQLRMSIKNFSGVLSESI
jgi:PAS domain S-box-containing protein